MGLTLSENGGFVATLEERLTQMENDLRQFKAGTVKAYQDLAVPFAIVRGLTESNVGQLAVVRATQDEHTAILREHTERLDSIDSRLNTFEQSVNSRFETQQRVVESFEQSVNSRLDVHDKRFDALDNKLDQIVGMLNTLTNKP